MTRSADHSWPALLDSVEVRTKSFVLAERELPSHMAKLPRRSWRPIAYWPVTLDWAAPALGLFPSASACMMVSEGFRTLVSLVLGTTRTGPPLLMHNRPFSPYMNMAWARFGPFAPNGGVAGGGCAGQE